MNNRNFWYGILACLVCHVSSSYTKIGKACRKNKDDKTNRDGNNVALTRVPDVKKCQDVCDSISGCTGIEFHAKKSLGEKADGNCEIWKVKITHSIDVDDFECYTKDAGAMAPAAGFADAVQAAMQIVFPKATVFDKNITDCLKKAWANAMPKTPAHYQSVQLTSQEMTKISDTELHAKFVVSSDGHVADLHNYIRSLATAKYKFEKYNGELKDHTHTLTGDVKACVDTAYKTTATVTWADTTLVNLKSKQNVQPAGGQSNHTNTSAGHHSGGQNGSGHENGTGHHENGTGNHSGNQSVSGTPTQNKTYTQSVTAKMSCVDVKKTMQNETKAKAAFKKAFEKSGGASVTETTLTKMGCPARRLETGFRRLEAADGGIKADFKYTATAAKTVTADAFTKDLSASLTEEGIEGVKVTSSIPTAATEVKMPTVSPGDGGGSTTKTASSAQKTSFFFVSFSFVPLAHAWC